MKPLLFLDVDGVINDLEAFMMLRVLRRDAPDRAEQLGVEMVGSGFYRAAVPHYMAGLIQEITSQAETWWCTAWRNHANEELAAHLGVGPFPVIDPDGTDRIGHDWKTDHVRPLAEAALSEGRTVVWIEDFNGDLPEIEGVVYIDTGERGRVEEI